MSLQSIQLHLKKPVNLVAWEYQSKCIPYDSLGKDGLLFVRKKYI